MNKTNLTTGTIVFFVVLISFLFIETTPFILGFMAWFLLNERVFVVKNYETVQEEFSILNKNILTLNENQKFLLSEQNKFLSKLSEDKSKVDSEIKRVYSKINEVKKTT